MEDDAEYCRAQAEKCKHLANLISAENVKAFLLERRRDWLKMADAHERVTESDHTPCFASAVLYLGTFRRAAASMR
jgi:hypothetical protein